MPKGEERNVKDLERVEEGGNGIERGKNVEGGIGKGEESVSEEGE